MRYSEARSGQQGEEKSAVHGEDGSTERSINGEVGAWSKADCKTEAAGRGKLRSFNVTRSGRASKLSTPLEKLSKGRIGRMQSNA